MNFIKRIPFFLFIVVCYTSYASENTYVLMGQNEKGDSTTFLLELMDSDIEQYCHISENGEIHLKADKIIAIPKSSHAIATSPRTAESMHSEPDSAYTLLECPNGHPSTHGDGRCNQRSCPFFRG